MTEPILTVENLTLHFPVKAGLVQMAAQGVRRALDHVRGSASPPRPVVHAVDGISFALARGEIFGLVGESGCGKTTTGRAVLRLAKPTTGRITFEGRDITNLKEKELRVLRPRMQIVFQDPHAALNPTMTIGQSIQDPLLVHKQMDAGEARGAALEVMEEVGLAPAQDLFDKYPADLSGGQQQRAVIARALILRPALIVADEPVAMLDMSIRARILELLMRLRDRHGITLMLITHDLATAKFVCDRIGIMYLGRIVETGSTAAIFRDPKHPYTRALLGAIPVPDPGHQRAVTLPRGEVPDAVRPPAGCRFHPRCPVALPTCGWEGRDFVAHLEERRLQRLAAEHGASRPVEEWTSEGLLARWRPPPDDSFIALGAGWFALSASTAIGLAAHLHSLGTSGSPFLGSGLTGPVAALGLALAAAGASAAVGLMRLRPEVGRIGAALAAADLLFSLYAMSRAITAPLLATLVAHVPLDAVLAYVLGGPLAGIALRGRRMWPPDAVRTARRLGEDMEAMLEAAPPSMAQAVQGVKVGEDSVEVRFRPPAPLAPREVDDRVVECLLY